MGVALENNEHKNLSTKNCVNFDKGRMVVVFNEMSL